MGIAALGEKFKYKIGASIGDAIEHDISLRPQQELSLAKFELVRLHVHAASAEAYALRLQPEPLLEGGVPAQFDFASRAENPLPWQSEGTV